MKSKKLTNQLLINKVIYLRVLHSFEGMIFNAFLDEGKLQLHFLIQEKAKQTF